MLHFGLMGFGLLFVAVLFASRGFEPSKDILSAPTQRFFWGLIAAALIFALLFLLAAWGMLKWTSWGWKLSVVVCMLNLIEVILACIFSRQVTQTSVLYSTILVAELVGFSIPDVRSEFERRNLAG